MKKYRFALIYPDHVFGYDTARSYQQCYEEGGTALLRNKKAVAMLIWSADTAIVVKRKMALEGKTVDMK